MRLIGFVALTLVAVVAIEGKIRFWKRFNAVKNEYIDKTVPDAETTLTAEDFNNANKLAAQMFVDTVDKLTAQALSTRGVERETIDTKAMEDPRLFEGDIANKGLDKNTIHLFMGEEDPNPNTPNPKDPSEAIRNAIRNTYARWPGAIIPYTLSTRYTSAARSIIADAMNQFALRSCIKIIPRTNEADYIHLMPDSGCYSYVGKIGGKQTVSLDTGCINRGIIMHELMHAVGFFHEQSRPDRDQYVEVLYQNIKKQNIGQFEKYSLNRVDYLGQPYDYYSVMHYGPRAFSKNGQDTISPIESTRAAGVTLGLRQQFSSIDVKELNMIAQCADASVGISPPTVSTTTTPHDTSSCQDTESSCPLWVKELQFCTNDIDTIQLRRRLCARTCNLC